MAWVVWRGQHKCALQRCPTGATAHTPVRHQALVGVVGTSRYSRRVQIRGVWDRQPADD
ncbi:hypothetical protein [Halorarius litoreus]|uniref:hypothetical protein n=1 Tax=Halorarius litoreus TaxID=2962676 RepID=UPI0020CF5438|nr:hypothetical protein [Halorarius litoreus]